MRFAAWLTAIALSSGCSVAETEPVPLTPPAPCEAPEVAVADGSCIRPGVPPEGCADGFTHDGGYGCEPILPAEVCAEGFIAVPGDEACRPVAPCGRGRWGDIAVDASTVYVDQSYSGASTGSMRQPWTTVSDAYQAAAPGAIIAIAQGRYVEDLHISDKAVRLWGVCPERVELVGTDAAFGAVTVVAGANGTEVRGVAVSGAASGIVVSGSQIVVQQVWVRTASEGIHAESTLGPTHVSVTDSLIEQSHNRGMSFMGVETIVKRTAVRSTSAGATSDGRGIVVQLLCTASGCNPTMRSRATLQGTVIEQNHTTGLFIASSDATVEGSVVRDTLPRVADKTGGIGINAQLSCWPERGCDPTTRSNVTLRSSVLEHNRQAGVFISGSDALVEHSVVRRTQSAADNGSRGRGINIQLGCLETGCDSRARSAVTVRSSLVEHNQQVGLNVFGSDAVVDATVVRETTGRTSDQEGGEGIHVRACLESEGCVPVSRANMAITRSLIDRNRRAGVVVGGSDVSMEASVVRDTQPQASDLGSGRGMNVAEPCDAQGLCDPMTPAVTVVRTSVFERNHEVSLLVQSSELTVEDSVVRATRPRKSDGLFGDGILVLRERIQTSARVTRVRVEDAARAALTNFGGFASLGDTILECAAVALNGEPYGGADFAFEDWGGNRCGCPAAEDACQVVSAGLQAPPPLHSTE